MAGIPKYDDPDELQKVIDAYFELCEDTLTITGLALACGFCSRQSMYDYEKKEKFAYIIKKARLRIENFYELKLLDKKHTGGACFALKNMGWSDEQHHTHEIKNELPVNVNITRDTK